MSSAYYQIREDFAAYQDPDGMISNQPRPGRGSAGNLVLFTAHYIWTLRRRSMLTLEDRSLALGSLFRCELERGLLSRTPNNIAFCDQEGPDDYIGYTSVAATCDELRPLARRFLDYGRTVRVPIRVPLHLSGHPILSFLFGWIRLRYVYNNLIPGTLHRPRGEGAEPNWTAWLGRFPAVIAHARFAAGERPGIFGRIFWLASVWRAGRFPSTRGTDDYILTWHLVAAYRASPHRSWACDWVAQDFMERLFATWPGGLNSVFAIYFGPAHPLTQWFLS